MSTPKRYLTPQVYQALAPQYVSGLLRGKARIRFIYLMQQHAEIREAVVAWEQKLDGLNNHLGELEPEPGSFDALQARIEPGRVDKLNTQTERIGLIQRWLSNWWLGSAGLAVSVLCISLLVWQNLQISPQINYVAVLENSSGNAQWIATSSKETRKLKLDRLGGALKSEENMVLWAISKEDGSYYRFAQVSDQSQEWIALNDEAWQKIKTAHALVMTLESDVSISQPEGMVIAKGLCVQIDYEKKIKT